MARPVSSRRALVITALVCLTPIVSHSIGRSVYGLLLTAMRDDFGLTNAQAGYPGSGIFLLYVVGVVTVLFVSPRVEPIVIMRTAVLLSVLGLVITLSSQGLAMLTLGVALVGGAGAGIWMTAPVLATEYVDPSRRGLVIGALTSTIGISNIAFGLGVGAWRNAADDPGLWRPVWGVALAFTTVVLLGLIALARFPVTERVPSGRVGLNILTGIPRWPSITLAYALFGGMTAAFGTFVVAALEDHGGVAESTSPVVFSLMGVTGMVAAPVAGALSDRVGRILVLRGALIMLTAANLAVAVGGIVPTIAGALLYGAGASTFPALIAALVRDSLGHRAFSQALALMTVLFSIMAAITPTVIGALADTSFRSAYLVLAALPALALLALAMGRDAPSPPATSPEPVAPGTTSP